MLNSIFESFYNIALSAIDKLPEISSFTVPTPVYSGIGSIFSVVGIIMPYSLYLPLIVFILSLTSFRIVYSVYLHFKK